MTEDKQAFFEANAQRVVDAARAIAEVYRGNGRMFSMGNGGSSCDGAHFRGSGTHAAGGRAGQVNPKIEVLARSARTGEGLEAWYQ